MLVICCFPFVGRMLIPLLGEYDSEAFKNSEKQGLHSTFEYFLGTLQQSYYSFVTTLFPLFLHICLQVFPEQLLDSTCTRLTLNVAERFLRDINAFWCLHSALDFMRHRRSERLNKKNRCRSLDILPGIPSPFCDREFCSCPAVSNSEMTGNQSPQDTSP